MIEQGEVFAADADFVYIRIPRHAAFDIQDQETCLVQMDDGRHIRADQRKKAWALITEISVFMNGDAHQKEKTHRLLAAEFVLNVQESLSKACFHLRDATVTTASEYISFLIEFIMENDIPTKESLLENCDDVERYCYQCLIHKKCCICGKKADLHHVDAIGMGNNRNKVNHFGRRALSLCRTHHQ